MAEIDVNAYATTAANAAAGAPSVIETQQPGATGALRQVMTIGDPTTRANMVKVTANGELVVADLDAAVVGTISATDVNGGTPTGTGVLINAAPSVGSFVLGTIPGGTSQIDLQILGTATGVYWFEYSLDSTTGSDGNWITGLFRQAGINNTVLTLAATTGGVYRGAAAAYKMFRVRNIGGTTPSNAITMRFSDGSGTVFLNASLPAGSNSIGTVKLPDVATFGPLAAVSAAITTAINSQGIAAIQLTGTWVGTISFQGTEDPLGVTAPTGSWFNVNGVASVSGLQLTNVTTNGQFRVNAGGYTAVRAIMTAFTSGSATVWINASLAPSMATLAEPLPFGTNTIGTVIIQTAATSVITSATAATASTTVLAANANRKGAYFYNDSTAVLYLAFAATASTTAYTVQLLTGGYYEMPEKPLYTGLITGIWAAVNGAVRVTELS